MFGALFGRDRKKPSICILEDEKETAYLLTQFLQGRGYSTRTAGDGALGLELIVKSRPDLVLLDIMMPGMNGFEVLLKLKSDPKTRDIPVIICSVLNDVRDVERCCQWGAEGYINKPFELERVARKIGAVLQPAAAN